MDTKFSVKVDIYVEWNTKLQQITGLKKLKYRKHHKVYKNNYSTTWHTS